MSETAKYFKSAITVDNVIFGFDNSKLKVLLIKRGEEPYKDMWALPGDFVNPDEDMDAAANRILNEMTGFKDVYLEQVETFGTANRHPLGRVITVAYYSLMKIENYNPISTSSMAKSVEWISVKNVRKLAFDHNEIFDSCVQRLQRQVRSRPIGFELLPPKFTLTELQHLYESILQTELDKRNFRKKILSMKILIDLEEMQEGVAHRPAKLYKFDPEAYDDAVAKGLSFELKESKPKRESVKAPAKTLASHY